MLISPYITPLCRICLKIICKSWGILEGISRKFLKEFLEVFEELLAHAKQAYTRGLASKPVSVESRLRWNVTIVRLGESLKLM